MGIDLKYGRVVLEHGQIGEDEPVVVFRARDGMLPGLLEVYTAQCVEGGSTARHIDLIQESKRRIEDWQRANPDLVRQPNSEASREWLDH